MITRKSNSDDAFTIERHGDITVITATPALERLAFARRESETHHGCHVDYFGSMFLELLIRCWKLALSQGGSMALSGVSQRTRELLRVTSLDIVWPIYDSKSEAMEAFELD